MNSFTEKPQQCWRITTQCWGDLVPDLLLVLQPLLEALLEERQLWDEVGDRVYEGVVGGVVRGRMDLQHFLQEDTLRTGTWKNKS